MENTFTLHQGDCLDVLRTLGDCSVDSIVTDPPYGLSFMGKKWDYDVPAVEIWEECLRVLKPGGHLLAFAGTRTQHRMAGRIEDAGFEIRDMAAWIYGSGFPKSLNVSKAIDKANGKHDRDLSPFGAYVRECREAKGWSLRQIDEAMGTNTAASWWEGRKAGIQPPGIDQYRKLKCILGMDGRFDELIEWLEAEREVVGKSTNGAGNGSVVGLGSAAVMSSEYDITSPATESARQWQGWGTALKPALEPITVARKPLIGTVAENVLRWGTGAINVDSCRIEGRERTDYGLSNSTRSHGSTYGTQSGSADFDSSKGRWPANLIHDGSDEVVALFPHSSGAGGSVPNVKVTGYGNGIEAGKSEYFGGDRQQFDSGTGSAARFFYCAKASKKDRDAGNDHPTVKPTDLMRYLCRLVTPPGGVVLDPFTGSGSTGKAAMLEGFRFIGCEREAEYIEIARARIQSVQPAEPSPENDNTQPDLFGATA